MKPLVLIVTVVLVSWRVLSSDFFWRVLAVVINTIEHGGRFLFSAPYRAALREARNPQTSPARLSELSSSLQLGILQALASNPNCAPSSLLELSKRFSKEVFENPALTLILLENPDFLRQLPAPALLYYLASPDADAHWEHTARHQEGAVRAAVAKHPNAPKQLKEELLFDHDQQVIAAALEALQLSPEILRLLLGVGWSPRLDLKKSGVDPSISTEELLRLADLFPRAERWIVGHPNASPGLLRRFSTSESDEVRRRIGCHPQISIELLEGLSHDTDPYVLQYVASHPKTPEPILERLAQNPQLVSKFYIARGRKLSEGCLRTLAQSQDQGVLSGVLNSREVPTELAKKIIRTLAPHHSEPYLWNIISSVTNNALIKQLASEDPDPSVREALQKVIERRSEVHRRSAKKSWSRLSGGILPKIW